MIKFLNPDVIKRNSILKIVIALGTRLEMVKMSSVIIGCKKNV